MGWLNPEEYKTLWWEVVSPETFKTWWRKFSIGTERRRGCA